MLHRVVQQTTVSCVMNNVLTTIHDTKITPIHSILDVYLSRVLNSLRYNKNDNESAFILCKKKIYSR